MAYLIPVNSCQFTLTSSWLTSYAFTFMMLFAWHILWHLDLRTPKTNNDSGTTQKKIKKINILVITATCVFHQFTFLNFDHKKQVEQTVLKRSSINVVLWELAVHMVDLFLAIWVSLHLRTFCNVVSYEFLSYHNFISFSCLQYAGKNFMHVDVSVSVYLRTFSNVLY